MLSQKLSPNDCTNIITLYTIEIDIGAPFTKRSNICKHYFVNTSMTSLSHTRYVLTLSIILILCQNLHFLYIYFVVL